MNLLIQRLCLLASCFSGLSILGAGKVVTVDGEVIFGELTFGHEGDLNVTTKGKKLQMSKDDWSEVDLRPPPSSPGLSDVSFRIHNGNWKKFPDFDAVPIDQSGKLKSGALDLNPLGSAGGQGEIYTFKSGTNLDRWDSPLVEGRSFSISTTITTNSTPLVEKEQSKLPELSDAKILEGILLEAVNFNELKTVRLVNEELVYHGDSEKPFSGWAIERRSNGELWSLRQYSKGKKDGVEAWWHANGKRWLENVFREGKRDGVWIEWSENGETKSRVNYNAGVRQAQVRKDTEVIIAQGGYIDGYSLYVQDGWLNFATRVNRKLTIARSNKPLPLNRPVSIVARLLRGGTMILSVDGRESARVWSPGVMIRMPLDGLQVGSDKNTPVGPYVGRDNRFKGKLDDVRFELEGTGITYEGKLTVTTPGAYQFNLGVDASSRLEIDGALLIDNSDPAKPANNWGKANLAAGVHDFRLTYAHLMPLKASGEKSKSSTPREVGRLDKVWIEDNLPAGAWAQGKFDFMGPPAPVFSGSKSFKLKVKGQGHLYFERARQPLAPAQEDILFGYCWLDPKDPPKEIIMQWHDRRGWEHRAYWGENIHNPGVGAHNTPRLWPAGPLPPLGKWTRLEVQAIAVGFAPGSPWPTIHGWGFVQVGGTVYWDKLGVSSPITVESTDSKHLNLNWYGPGLTEHALSGKSDVSEKPWEVDDVAIPTGGILAKDGSYFAEIPQSLDNETIRLKSFTIARDEVAALFFQEISFLEAATLGGKGSGVLIQSGEFLDGRVISIEGETLRINADPARKQEYRIHEEVVAVVLNQTATPAPKFKISLKNGSSIYASGYNKNANEFALSGCGLPLTEIPEVWVVGIKQGIIPNPLRSAWSTWRRHSPSGQVFLEGRDRVNRELVAKVTNFRAQIEAAKTFLKNNGKELDKASVEVSEAEKRREKAKAMMEGEIKKGAQKSGIHSETKKNLASVRGAFQTAEKKLGETNATLHKSLGFARHKLLPDAAWSLLWNSMAIDSEKAFLEQSRRKEVKAEFLRSAQEQAKLALQSIELVKKNDQASLSTLKASLANLQGEVIDKSAKLKDLKGKLDGPQRQILRSSLEKRFEIIETLDALVSKKRIAGARIEALKSELNDIAEKIVLAEKTNSMASNSLEESRRARDGLKSLSSDAEKVLEVAKATRRSSESEFERVKDFDLRSAEQDFNASVADLAEANSTYAVYLKVRDQLQSSVASLDQTFSGTNELSTPGAVPSKESNSASPSPEFIRKLKGSILSCIEALSSQLRSLEQKSIEANASIEKVAGERKSAQLAMEKLKGQAEDAKKDLQEAQAAAEQLTAKTNMAENESIAASTKLAVVKREAGEVAEKLSDTQEMLSAETVSLQKAMVAQTVVMQDLTRAFSVISEAEETLLSAKSDLDLRESALKSATDHLSGAISFEKAAKNEFDNQRKRLDGARVQFNAAKTKVQAARARLDALTLGKSGIEAKLLEAKSRVLSIEELSFAKVVADEKKAVIETYFDKAEEVFKKDDKMAGEAEASAKKAAVDAKLSKAEKDVSREEALALRRVANESLEFLNELKKVPLSQASRKSIHLDAAYSSLLASGKAAEGSLGKSLASSVTATIHSLEKDQELLHLLGAKLDGGLAASACGLKAALLSRTTELYKLEVDGAKRSRDHALAFSQAADAALLAASVHGVKLREQFQAVQKELIAVQARCIALHQEEVSLATLDLELKKKVPLAQREFTETNASLEVARHELLNNTRASTALGKRLEELETKSMPKAMSDLARAEKGLESWRKTSEEHGQVANAIRGQLAMLREASKTLAESLDALSKVKGEAEPKTFLSGTPKSLLAGASKMLSALLDGKVKVALEQSRVALESAEKHRSSTGQMLEEQRQVLAKAQEKLKATQDDSLAAKLKAEKAAKDLLHGEKILVQKIGESNSSRQILSDLLARRDAVEKGLEAHQRLSSVAAEGFVATQKVHAGDEKSAYSAFEEIVLLESSASATGEELSKARAGMEDVGSRTQLAHSGLALIELRLLSARHRLRNIEGLIPSPESVSSRKTKASVLAGESKASTDRLLQTRENLEKSNRSAMNLLTTRRAESKLFEESGKKLSEMAALDQNATRDHDTFKDTINRTRGEYNLLNQLYAEKKRNRQSLLNRINVVRKRQEMMEAQLGLLLPKFQSITRPD